MDIGGYDFTHVSRVFPERATTGKLVEFYPHKSMQTSLPLLPYGEGPFCQFSIPDNIKRSGVYALTLDSTLIYYIGETINLSQRYNRGYGFIEPRACYQGGQATNLRINSFLFHAVSADIAVDLWFYAVSQHKEVEAELIVKFKPKWNRQGVTRAPSPHFSLTPKSEAPTPILSATRNQRNSTCRLEILECVKGIIERTGKNEFTLADIIRSMHASGTTYKTITIELHVTSKMCLSGPAIHNKRYDDFEQAGPQSYRLK